MYNIAIFASGSGTNAENLIKSFRGSEIRVARVFCNNPAAGVIARAEKLHVPVTVFGRTDFYETENIVGQLAGEKIDYIILAGFLWLLPETLIHIYNDKIINIHPALLPKYGGKGMYGHHVHEAVVAHGEKESGITIHLVNEDYDSGRTLFQATCPVLPDDTPEKLAAKVHELEYQYFPQVVKEYILG